MNKQILNILLLLSAIFITCEKKNNELPAQPPKPVYFSKSQTINFDHEKNQDIFIFCNQNDSLIGLIGSKNGLYETISKNEGHSWSTPQKIFDFKDLAIPVITKNRLLGVQVLKKIKNGGQLYFCYRGKNGFEKSAIIRDTNWGDFGAAAFSFDKNLNIYCVWVDWRNGNPDVYFSSSIDSGKTWSANVQINEDHSGQEQSACYLISAPDGTLYAFWDDNRSAKTLFDIFCSVSTDGGQTWSRNIKINDDTLHVWQRNPHAICDKDGNIYIAWYDYRDKGTHGDVIANIYFSRSTDGGKSWLKNVKISRASLGHCLYPRLKLSADKTLHCLYGSYDSKHRSDVFYSYSLNNGLSWSEPTKVNDNLKRQSLDYRSAGVFTFSDSDVYVGWYSQNSNKNTIFLSKRIFLPASDRSQKIVLSERLVEHVKIKTLNYRHKRLVFADDFIDQISKHWQEISGIWVWKDHNYIGYDVARSMIKTKLLKNFEFSGRFKLDPLNHQAAYVFVRSNKKGDESWSYYRILNFFRVGVNIDYLNGDRSEQIIQKSYPFRENIRYDFKVIMKGSRLNYFINDSLILSAGGLFKNPEGLLGIGSGTTPTYFKDIRVYEIK